MRITAAFALVLAIGAVVAHGAVASPASNALEAKTQAFGGVDGVGLASGVDEPSLAAILAAWNDATERLQATHEVLQAEVAELKKAAGTD